MKKHLVAILFMLLTGSVFSNPVIMPPVISEIFWDENGWTMELFFDDMFYCNNLNELTLICNEDTSAFKTGIPIVLNQPMVVTKDDLIEPFELPISGGYIDILETASLFPITEPLIYGDNAGSRISAVLQGQSIVNQKFTHYYEDDYYFWLVKETQPSIGELPFTCQTRANFSGKVVDKFLNPVPIANINYIFQNINQIYFPTTPTLITDENGEFSTDQMFCREYTVRIYVNNEVELFTNLDVEPDSANYFYFQLDTVYDGVNENVIIEQKFSMNVSPNPFNRNLNINIQMTKNSLVKSSKLKLFDLTGNIVKSTSINSPYLNNIDIYWKAMDEVVANAGIYLLALEVEGKIVASQKVIFQK